MPTYSFGDDPLDADEKAQVRQVAADLGLGRVRTLSVEGRDLAAQRWYDGDAGPGSPLAQQAPASCTTCGFLLRLAGPLAGMFGVCANGNANDDGRIVSLDHGCGAHSEVQLTKKQLPVPPPDHVHDTLTPATSSPSEDPAEASRARSITGLPARRAVAPAAAVLQAEQPEPEAGQAGPEPPDAAAVLEPAVERQQREEREEPQADAHLEGADAVDVERARRRPRCRCGCRSRASSAARRAPREQR